MPKVLNMNFRNCFRVSNASYYITLHPFHLYFIIIIGFYMTFYYYSLFSLRVFPGLIDLSHVDPAETWKFTHFLLIIVIIGTLIERKVFRIFAHAIRCIVDCLLFQTAIVRFCLCSFSILLLECKSNYNFK